MIRGVQNRYWVLIQYWVLGIDLVLNLRGIDSGIGLLPNTWLNTYDFIFSGIGIGSGIGSEANTWLNTPYSSQYFYKMTCTKRLLFIRRGPRTEPTGPGPKKKWKLGPVCPRRSTDPWFPHTWKLVRALNNFKVKNSARLWQIVALNAIQINAS